MWANTKDGYDVTTKSLRTIDYPHSEIHAGDHFIFNDYDGDVDIAGPKYYRIITPNTTKWAHCVIEVTASAAGVLAFYENPTINAAGDAGTVYNMNRNSSTANTSLIKKDSTTTNDGTLIWSDYIGASGHPLSTFGGSAYSRIEFVLKQNEDYVLKFTTDADNNKLWTRIMWYEHTNANA